MKNLITSLCLLFLVSGFGQNSTVESSETAKMSEFKDLSITLEVDSAEDLEKSFKISDIINLMAIATEDQEIALQIICNGKKMSDGVKSSLAYKIKGNTAEKEEFMAKAQKIRKAALKYYNKE